MDSVKRAASPSTSISSLFPLGTGRPLAARYVSATSWDLLLPWYDPLVALFTRERRFKSHLLDRARLRPGHRLLDIGCGSGTLALEAIRREPSLASVVGVDVDPRMLDQAKKKLGPESRVRLLTADATQLCSLESGFDVVLTSLLLHHLRPDEKIMALGEVYRVLAPGGRLLLADFGAPASFLAQMAFLSVRVLDGWARTRCNALGRLPHLIAESGLTNVCETMVLHTPLGTLRCYEALKPNA